MPRNSFKPVHSHARRGSKSPTYRAWESMIGRCTRPSAGGFAHYGGRGIEVCHRWRGFENFLADMGERPAGMSLERKDNEGPYAPDNCRWASYLGHFLHANCHRLLERMYARFPWLDQVGA